WVALHDLTLLVADRHPAVGPHGGHQEHVRALVAGADLEPLRGVLAQDGGRERPKAFAELDLPGHLRLHPGRAGVAADSARPQRPRAELHPALEPADDLALGEPAGGLS